MATIRLPVDLRNPQMSANPGNSRFRPIALTDWDAGLWEFEENANGKIFGIVGIPANIAGTPAAHLLLQVCANATTGVTRLSVATTAVANAESFNPAALTGETAQDITVPATAYLRKEVRFPTSGSLGVTVAANDLLIVEVYHEGAHTNDTLTVPTLLIEAQLGIDI